jgi:hypothetical protein
MADPYKYRNPDGSLRLDELLGARYVRHYTAVLESSSEKFREMQLAIAEAPPDSDEDWRAYQEQPRGTMTEDGWLIAREGSGEPLASSCQDLAVRPEVCWDVCGYYRRLGVHWRASSKDIRLAYLAKDPLSKDEPLFYAMSQLVDPVIRRAYDLMPLGGMFMGDRGVREAIDRAAAFEASRRNAEAWWAGEDYDAQEQQQKVRREWGFEQVSQEEAAERLADGTFQYGSSGDALGSSLDTWTRYWSWYTVTDPYDDGRLEDAPVADLPRWQAMIAKALSRLGIRDRFSVGTWPGHGAKMWHDSNKCCIFTIGRGEITQDMACEAAEGYAAQVRHTRRHQRRQVLCPFSTRVSTRPRRPPTSSRRTGRSSTSGPRCSPFATGTSTTCTSSPRTRTRCRPPATSS